MSRTLVHVVDGNPLQCLQDRLTCGAEIFFINTVEEPKYAHFVSRICDRCFIWDHTLTSLLINCTMMMQECTFTIIICVVNSQGLIRIIVFLRHLFSELEVLQSNKCISRFYLN